jgi:hypothetical protein
MAVASPPVGGSGAWSSCPAASQGAPDPWTAKPLPGMEASLDVADDNNSLYDPAGKQWLSRN